MKSKRDVKVILKGESRGGRPKIVLMDIDSGTLIDVYAGGKDGSYDMETIKPLIDKMDKVVSVELDLMGDRFSAMDYTILDKK